MDRILLQGNLKNIIKDSLMGLTCMNQEIALFGFGNVVVQKNYFGNESLRVVSGGANFFAEFVGKGMLTAAIQGESYMAPPSKVILRTIRELSLNHLKGVLIIVPANSGDLLNFGLATERALNDNISVKLLSVSDDFNTSLPKICRTGLSGIVLVNKIAGAMSEKDKSLNEVYSFCKSVTKNMISSGIILPTAQKHGNTCICREADEPYRKKSKIDTDVCRTVVDEILTISPKVDKSNTKLNLNPGEGIIVLLNNIGGLSKIEECIFIKEMFKVLHYLGIKIQRFYAQHFIRCTRTINLTISILKVFNNEVLEYLDDPCSAPGWKKVNQNADELVFDEQGHLLNGNLKRKDRLAPPIRGPKLSEREANVLLLSMQFACDAIISCENQLNIIDAELGDGDTGTRLKYACEVLQKRMNNKKLITNYPFTFFESLSKLLEATVGGTAGCIYSTLFEAAANCFGECCETEPVTPLMWLNALRSACNALRSTHTYTMIQVYHDTIVSCTDTGTYLSRTICQTLAEALDQATTYVFHTNIAFYNGYGNVDVGDGTMYDPLFVCATTVKDQLDSAKNFVDAFGKGVAAAEEAAQQTKRAKQKYPDSGAHAVGIWMRAVFEGVKLRCPIE